MEYNEPRDGRCVYGDSLGIVAGPSAPRDDREVAKRAGVAPYPIPPLIIFTCAFRLRR